MLGWFCIGLLVNTGFADEGEDGMYMTVIPAVVEVKVGEWSLVSAKMVSEVGVGGKFTWEVIPSKGVVEISGSEGSEVRVVGVGEGEAAIVVRNGLHWERISVIVSNEDQNDEWVLVWEDDFLGTTFNRSRWSKIRRGSSDWCQYMSEYDGLFEVKDSILILRGVKNTFVPTDPAPYLTGALETANKVGFANGRLEISAKFFNARGAWPAFWLMPTEPGIPWPKGGEIDIMERLNGDPIAHQTVHSSYTEDLKIRNIPPHSKSSRIKQGEFNTYGVELNPNDVTFTLNGVRTFSYPRILTNKTGQFPYNREWYLMLDMQLGGQWVGPIHPEDLPVDLWIDWVRFYKRSKSLVRD
jgi:beta-glucanase (GH16 family)